MKIIIFSFLAILVGVQNNPHKSNGIELLLPNLSIKKIEKSPLKKIRKEIRKEHLIPIPFYDSVDPNRLKDLA